MCTIKTLVLASILFLGLAAIAPAAAQDSTGRNGALTIPWDEFKLLLNLDGDEIVLSWETFQKLLAMTDGRFVPSTVKGGNVVLTRDEFDSLVARMKIPPHIIEGRPVDYLITRAVYDGKMKTGSTAFTATFKLHVLKENAFVRIPIIPTSVPLEDIRVDGKPALVINENGFHTIVLSRDGEYTITATFSLASALDKGPNKIDLSILQTPITLLNLEMPLKDIDVEIPQAQQVLATVSGNNTLIRAAITTGNNVSIRWRKKIEQIDKIPPKLHAELYHLLSIEDGAMIVNTDISLNILYSEIDAVRVSIPDGLHVLSVTGEGVGEWQESAGNNGNSILIPFTYGKKGAAGIRLTAEIPSTESGLANVFSGITVDEAVREKGFIGVMLNTSAEVTIVESKNLEQVPPQRLPIQIQSKSAKPLTMGFKYLKQPFNLVLDIKKHDKVAVPVAVINSANVVTLFTEDGKIVHRILYQVKNSAKQFLRISLPDGADLWTVLVDNKPEESSVSESGELLVPLIRSRSDGVNLETFSVEVIYCMVEDKFDMYGSRGSTLPTVDLLISQVMWSVYLPNDYTYHHFSSSLEVEQMVRGLNLFSGPIRQYDELVMREALASGKPSEEDLKKAYGDKEYASKFRNVPMAPAQQQDQIQQELVFNSRMEVFIRGGRGGDPSYIVSTGVLPIQIQIPTSGQVYRFARTIIKPGDPLTFDVAYSRHWVAGFVKWVLLIAAAFVVWMNRRRFCKPWQRFTDGVRTAISFVKKHEAAIHNASKSIMMPFVLIGLTVIFSTVSIRLALLFFVLFWISTAWHVVNFLKKKSSQRASLKTATQRDATAE